MTKEELKQEAEEWLCNNLHSASEEDFIKGMVDIAEPREKRIAELEKENAELKEEWQEQVQKATDEGYARTLQTIQLTKAKEIIKNLLILKNDHYGNTKMEWRVKVTEQAEQFLNSEVEK